LIAKWQSLFGNPRNRGNTGRGGDPGGPVIPRSLTYWLTVQKMREDKAYQEPFKSSGQEIFESGYKFRLNVSVMQSGYLYVFNEGSTDRGDLSFTIIYP